MLFQFKSNLTPNLKTEIVTKGTAETILDTIIAYADTLKAANILQEGTKGTRKEITAEAITEFNNIFDDVISIAKIAANFYKNNVVLKQQFSFTKVAKTINAGKKSTAP